uniref:Fatty acid hydroxylase domain-containing protein n=1 Tax=Strombidium inclinatum TaxID=197538 RepID=A0A7S3IDP4_9SPIT|mmetsp:Transcript_12749/g.19757  ORF Transcript_12749/g.19757 Transcript_12749/m.19757 type:complete len:209 (+) Transcript_12749:534-1160(+)
MFDSWFFEVNSKTPWYAIPLAYIPISCYLFYMMEGTWLNAILGWVSGVVGWSFTEYMLHRFVFHGEDVFMPYLPKSNLLYVLHFSLHGIHHAFPEDTLRLVFPPLLGHILLYYLFLVPITNNFPAWFSFAFMLGLLQGYQTYDCFHYFLHHSTPAEGTYTKEMKVYHMQHHYKYGLTGFGVSNKFWDFVFGTEIKMKVKPPTSYSKDE